MFSKLRTKRHLLVIGDFSDQNFCNFAGASVQVVVELPLSEEGDVSADSDDRDKTRPGLSGLVTQQSETSIGSANKPMWFWLAYTS